MFKKIICFLTYHKYHLEKQLIPGFRKINCERCGRSWLSGDTIRDVPWSDDFEEVIESFGENK